MCDICLLGFMGLGTCFHDFDNDKKAWHLDRRNDVSKPEEPESLILESWAQGYMVGSLIIMAAITIANMRRGVLLHKLIFLELILGCFMGFFMFTNEPIYGWYLSASAVPLNISWSLHNVIAWMKTKPFLSKMWSKFFIGTVVLVQPYWAMEIYCNFTYFNNINACFVKTRPFEALFRDPWWLFTTVMLLYQIMRHYRLPFYTIIFLSPRFGILLLSMLVSLVFIVLDIISVTGGLNASLAEGLNPFWKMAFVFKCLCDSIVLDDFKTALDRLMRHKMRREGFGPREGPACCHGDALSSVATSDTGCSPTSSPTSTTSSRSVMYRGYSVEDREALKRMDPLSEDAIEKGISPPGSTAIKGPGKSSLSFELTRPKSAGLSSKTIQEESLTGERKAPRLRMDSIDTTLAKYLGPSRISSDPSTDPRERQRAST